MKSGAASEGMMFSKYVFAGRGEMVLPLPNPSPRMPDEKESRVKEPDTLVADSTACFGKDVAPIATRSSKTMPAAPEPSPYLMLQLWPSCNSDELELSGS